jgi:hypothetical protein
MPTDLNGQAFFVAVAEAKGSRPAGRDLGVSGSAVSQAIGRLDEVISPDMVAMPGSDELRLIVVGAPVYFEDRPVPEHPRDLSGPAPAAAVGGAAGVARRCAPVAQPPASMRRQTTLPATSTGSGCLAVFPSSGRPCAVHQDPTTLERSHGHRVRCYRGLRRVRAGVCRSPYSPGVRNP